MNLQTLSTGSACVNDVHSGLNRTAVRELAVVDSTVAVQQAVRRASALGLSVIASGGRYSMGGQQFASEQLVLDMRGLNRIISLDRDNGLVHVESGITWPQLIEGLRLLQSDCEHPWSIIQKQTGADDLTIGGAVASNVHGRGLGLCPFIGDVVQITLVDASGNIRICSRTENQELFALVFGGYGLFGVVTEVVLRLTPLSLMRRRVQVVRSEELIDRLNAERAMGCSYGDFQFSIDDRSGEFLTTGIMSTYQRVDSAAVDENAQHNRAALSRSDWQRLLYLAHTDKARAFEQYREHYLRTDGQYYSSDVFQLSTYLDGYHKQLDVELCSQHGGSEIITEIYVPRTGLHQFLLRAGSALRARNADLIYGTVRLIEEDRESFMPWAKQSYACVIFNLHTEHTPEGIARSAAAFTDLIDLAIAASGSYYLTYHRFASLRQLQTCYPRFAEFVEKKRLYDPAGLFSSDWYQHYASQLQ